MNRDIYPGTHVAQLMGLAKPGKSLLSDMHLSYHDREIQLRDQAHLLPRHSICVGPMLGWPEGLQPVAGTNLLHPQHGRCLALGQACAHLPECSQFEFFLVENIVFLKDLLGH